MPCERNNEHGNQPVTYHRTNPSTRPAVKNTKIFNENVNAIRDNRPSFGGSSRDELHR